MYPIINKQNKTNILADVLLFKDLFKKKLIICMCIYYKK